MNQPQQTQQPVYGRRARISAGQVRAVVGEDLRAGDLIPTGLILQVDRDEQAHEVRLEMVGADIHYVGFDEPVTVFASVDEDVLDAVSVGTFVARAELRLVPSPPEPIVVDSEPETGTRDLQRPREGKRNRGPLGQYAQDVQHYLDICPIHGETTFALHKTGKRRSGEQRYSRRCLACHADYNLDHHPS